MKRPIDHRQHVFLGFFYQHPRVGRDVELLRNIVVVFGPDFFLQHPMVFRRRLARAAQAHQDVVGRDAFEQQNDALVGLQPKRERGFAAFEPQLDEPALLFALQKLPEKQENSTSDNQRGQNNLEKVEKVRGIVHAECPAIGGQILRVEQLFEGNCHAGQKPGTVLQTYGVNRCPAPAVSAPTHRCPAAVSLHSYLLFPSQLMASVATLAPIALTPRALVEVKNIIQEKNVPADYGLRIGVQGGGCSGMSYLLGFDKAKEADETYDLDGVLLVMDKKHAMYVLGMEVDFQDGLNARGFVFNNPQAKSTCGCGSSFSA